MKILLFLIGFASLNAMAGGHVVGNGGDGFLVGDRVVLRDLVEAGLEERAYYGDRIDTSIAFSVTSLSVVSPSQRSLLTRKLTDLNLALPRLGDIVLDVLKAYSWSFVSTPLETIPDDGSIIQPPSGGTPVQIANRMGSTIRIHLPHWNRMSADHQVALLLHEAFYSLLRPKPDGGVFRQSSLATRELIGHIFSEDFLKRGPARLQRMAKSQLSVDWSISEDSTPRTLAWDLEVFDARSNQVLLQAKGFQQQTFAWHLDRARSVCRRAIEHKTDRREIAVRSTFNLKIFRVELAGYESPFGEQLAARAVLNPAQRMRELIFTVTDQENCVAQLRNVIDSIIGQN